MAFGLFWDISNVKKSIIKQMESMAGMFRGPGVMTEANTYSGLNFQPLMTQFLLFTYFFLINQ